MGGRRHPKPGYPALIDLECVEPIPDCGMQIVAEVVPWRYVLPR